MSAFPRLVPLLAAVALSVGCSVSTSPSNSDGTPPGAATETSEATPTETSTESTPSTGGQCCPADAQPACCMDYGGWSASGSCGGRMCDGMPVPADPGWKLTNDEHGCPTWTHPNNIFRGGKSSPTVETCGGVRKP